MNLANLFPLAALSFEPGSCAEAMSKASASWSDETRALANVELCYLQGDYDKARLLLRGLVGCDEVLKLPSVCYFWAYSCLATGDLRESRRAFACLQEAAQRLRGTRQARRGSAAAIANAFVADTAQVALHMELPGEKGGEAADLLAISPRPSSCSRADLPVNLAQIVAFFSKNG